MVESSQDTHKALGSSPTTGRKDKEMLQVAATAETVFRPKCVADIALSTAGMSSMELNSYYNSLSKT